MLLPATWRPRFSATNVSTRENHSLLQTRSRSGFFQSARRSSLHVHTHGVRVFAWKSHGSYARFVGMIGCPVSSSMRRIACINHDSDGPGVDARMVVTCVFNPTGSTHASSNERLTNDASSTICRSAT